MIQHSISTTVVTLQRDLAEVADTFALLYGQSLSEFVSDDCDGDYKRLLLAVID